MADSTAMSDAIALRIHRAAFLRDSFRAIAPVLDRVDQPGTLTAERRRNGLLTLLSATSRRGCSYRKIFFVGTALLTLDRPNRSCIDDKDPELLMRKTKKREHIVLTRVECQRSGRGVPLKVCRLATRAQVITEKSSSTLTFVPNGRGRVGHSSNRRRAHPGRDTELKIVGATLWQREFVRESRSRIDRALHRSL